MLDEVRKGVIIEVGVERLSEPMRVDMTNGDWIGAAFEIWSSPRLNREMGEERCKDLANALEYGYWGAGK